MQNQKISFIILIIVINVLLIKKSRIPFIEHPRLRGKQKIIIPVPV